MDSTTPKKDSARRRVLAVVGVFVLLLSVAFAFAKPLLTVQRGPAQADVIVVLGGESSLRAGRALELFQAGAAKSIIVSGDGHKGDIETFLLQHGISPAAIQLEPSSRNTKENAEFSCALMRTNGIKSAIVVTSWYHSRRALACFQKFGKGMQFSSLPTLKHEPRGTEWQRFMKEYLKMVWYLARYQVPPWT